LTANWASNTSSPDSLIKKKDKNLIIQVFPPPDIGGGNIFIGCLINGKFISQILCRAISLSANGASG
jgi:hypothetical protein